MPGRESRDREYEVGLVAGVGIRYRLDIEQGEVTAFTIQLEDYDEADGKWRPVVRAQYAAFIAEFRRTKP